MEAASKKLLEKSAAPSASRAVEGQCKPYAIRTEEAYVNWIRCYIYFHNIRHPAEMGAPERRYRKAEREWMRMTNIRRSTSFLLVDLQ